MDTNYKYDVALSFAGEQRKYVEEVAYYLKEHDIKVFYDYFERVKLWGQDLVTKLETIYSYESMYCAIFISSDYIKKDWTCHECAAAAQRMLKNRTKNVEYILPIKFDSTKVPGILETTAYVDANTFSPEDIGRMIREKVIGNAKLSALTPDIIMDRIDRLLKAPSNLEFINIDFNQKNNRYKYDYYKNGRLIYTLVISIVLKTATEIILEIYENLREPAYYIDIPSAIINIYMSCSTIKVKNFSLFFCDTSKLTFENFMQLLAQTISKNLEGN